MSILEFLFGKSWRTGLAGLSAFAVILFQQIQNGLDSDPATVVDYNLIVASALAAFGLLQSRDNGVTSEQAKAQPGSLLK